MVEIISGKKGKGKTKILLDKANEAAKSANGSIVYLDKSSKHMYELNNQIRLINVMDYGVDSYEKFMGFAAGIIASNHDIEKIFLDSFLKVANVEAADIAPAIAFLDKVAGENDVEFIISISADTEELPEETKEFVKVAL